MGAREFLARYRGRRHAVAASRCAGAARDVLTLRNLGGGGHGCNDDDERFSMTRRRLHHAMFYGFLLCFAVDLHGSSTTLPRLRRRPTRS